MTSLRRAPSFAVSMWLNCGRWRSIGLKPILRRVWARRGKRPPVLVRPRYEWLYLCAFVCPEFWLAPGANAEI